MDPTIRHIDRMYIYPVDCDIDAEKSGEWFIDHLNQPLHFDPGRRIFILSGNNELSTTVEAAQVPQFQVVCASPIYQENLEFETYQYNCSTEARCFLPTVKLTFVIDGSPSMLQANDAGTCYIHDAIHTLCIMLEQLVRDTCLPGTNFLLPPPSVIVSVILLIPRLQSFTLLFGWRANAKELTEKLHHINQGISTVGLYLIEKEKDTVHSNFVVGSDCGGILFELLKQGLFSASLLSGNHDSSLVILTDAAFATKSFEMLDRSLNHLRTERIRCSFVLVNPTEIHSPCAESSLERIISMNPCLSQPELCTFLAEATKGFVLTSSCIIAAASEHHWNSIKEAFFTILVNHPSSDRIHSINWDPICSMHVHNKCLKAPLKIVLRSRLREGYILKRVLLNPTASVVSKQDEQTATPNVSSEFQSDPVVQLSLEMPWKIDVTLHLILRGHWITNYSGVAAGEVCVSGSGNTDSQSHDENVTEQSQSSSSTHSRTNYCELSLSVAAGYSMLQRINCRPPDNHSDSAYKRFVLYKRLSVIADSRLEHLNKFLTEIAASEVPGTLQSRVTTDFESYRDNTEKSIAMSGRNHESGNQGRFLHFWRLFSRIDLWECYRWLNIYSLYCVLEHDSPLPNTLYLPLTSNSNILPITFRQALEQLHNALLSWCSFVLIDGEAYVRIISPDPSVHPNDPERSDYGVGESPFCLRKSRMIRSFCIVRLELNLPEVRVRVAFLAGTSTCLEWNMVEDITEMIRSVRFPPRGRQAVPKSRHKSGAVTLPEVVPTPPLQRSWEDTPCCHLFRPRLDRLVLNSGFWTNLPLAHPYTVKYSVRAPWSSKKKRSDTRLHTSAVQSHGSIHSTSLRPHLDFSLVKQHLHFNGQMWIVQPGPITTDGLVTIFSSLLNLRLQEGFHLARVGPQPGFINLITEVEFSSPNSLAPRPCLIQYHLYPLCEHRGVINYHSHARDLINEVISNTNGKTLTCRKCNEELACANHPFNSTQIATEVWIQPIDGHITGIPPEAEDWNQVTYDQVAKQIFQIDEHCICSYVTLERLFAITTSIEDSDSNIISLDSRSDTGSRCFVDTCNYRTTFQYVHSDVIELVKLSPQVTLLVSALGDTEVSAGSFSPNDYLLNHFCASILCRRYTVEVILSTEDCASFTHHLCARGEFKNLDSLQHPKWRCFASLMGSSCRHDPTCYTGDEISAKPMTTLIFVPVCGSPLVRHIIQNKYDVDISIAPKIPIFIYSSSRSYLSFLIDDRWTYKVPPDLWYDVSIFGSKTSPSSYWSMSVPPSSYIAAGCQNARLTNELDTIWKVLRCMGDFLIQTHVDAFVTSVYWCLSSQIPVDSTSLDYVLNITKTNSHTLPLILDLTAFYLFACSQFSTDFRKVNGNPDAEFDATTLLTGSVGDAFHTVDSSFSLNGEDSSCVDAEVYEKLLQWFDQYVYSVPNRPGVFLVKNPQHTQPASVSCTSSHMQSYSGQTLRDRPSDAVTKVVSDQMTRLSMSNESDTSETVDTENPICEPLMRRSVLRKSTDSLVQTVTEWFGKKSSFPDPDPLFLNLELAVTYDSRTIRIPVRDGRDVFCAVFWTKQIHPLLHSDVVHEDMVRFNPSLLRIELEIKPVMWHSAVSSGMEPEKTVDNDLTQFICPSLLADDVYRSLISWIKQPSCLGLDETQKGLLCRFLFRLTWELSDILVCSLLPVSPPTESMLHFVLRHIEDTDILNATSFFYTDRILKDATRVGEDDRVCVDDETASQLPSYIPTPSSRVHKGCCSSVIKLHRIRLDFVSNDPEAYTYFIQGFEQMSFDPIGACLEQLNGCYFLTLSSVASETQGSSKLSFSSKIPNGFQHPSPLKSPELPGKPYSRTTSIKSKDTVLSTESYFVPDHRPLCISGELSGYPSSRKSSDQSFPPVEHAPCSLGYEGDFSESDLESELNLKTFPDHSSSTQLTRDVLTDEHEENPETTDPRCSSYCMQARYNTSSTQLLPYWLLFRPCINTVSLFFHHHHGQLQSLSSTFHPRYPDSKSTSCSHCCMLRVVFKKISNLIRLVNQRLLLKKLRAERVCDVLLRPAPPTSASPVTASTGPARKMGLLGLKPKTWRKRPISQSADSQVCSSDERLANLTSIGQAPSSDSPVHRTLPFLGSQRTSLDGLTVRLPKSWHPGCFACPVQLTDRIRLHPCVFSAVNAMQQSSVSNIDKDKRVVAALRKLLDKPAILNQPDMFFLIDLSGRHVNAEQQPTNLACPGNNFDAVTDTDPVFYMLLKEITVQPSKHLVPYNNGTSSDLEATHSERVRTRNFSASCKKFHSRTTFDKASTKHFLLYTLHGISKPSRRLCKDVREMLQFRLDSLVLDYFSDSLSRNAITRLSEADVTFLLSRRFRSPRSHYTLCLPQWLSDKSQKPFNMYPVNSLVLAFCHYLKQKLSCCLHPVKLEHGVTICESDQPMEWFLYNRPRAHGVAKPGVAAIVIQLLAPTHDTQVLIPNVISEWSLPNELTSLADHKPTLQDLNAALSDILEFDGRPNLSHTDGRLVLSIKIWERGDADICSLKSRLKSVITHSLYDLLMEFFVLVSPVNYVQYSPPSSVVPAEVDHSPSSKRSLLNPVIDSLVRPWFQHGHSLDSLLVTKCSPVLLSTSVLPQLLLDLLTSFGQRLSASDDVHLSTIPLVTNVAGTAPSSLLGSPNSSFHDSLLNSLVFYMFAQSTTEPDTFIQSNWNELVQSQKSLLPGESKSYLLVGRNFNAWRKLIRRTQRFPSGSSILQGSVDHLDQYRRHKSSMVPAMDYDHLSRMQPLQATLIPSVSEQPMKQSTDTGAAQSSSIRHKATPHSRFTVDLSGSMSSAEKLPEFCHIIPHSTKPTSSTVTNDDGCQLSASSTAVFSADERSSVVTTLSPKKPTGIPVYVPRQTFCLLQIEGRQLTLYTYNWVRDEAERFANRLQGLVEWYNCRHTLLNSLALQKLGLFHTLCDPLSRWCASKHAQLTLNQTHLDSIDTFLSGAPPQLDKSLTTGTKYTRRRHPTTGTESQTPNVPTGTTPVSTGSAMKSNQYESQSVDNYLQLYRDCGRIPSLDLFRSPDLLHRHGRQALACIERDRRRTSQLSLISLPFRAWQQGRSRSASRDHRSTLFQTPESPTHGNSAASEAESLLTNEPFAKRVQCYSSIRIACRQLHTICTPILFCPKMRFQTVQATQRERVILCHVASKCYEAQLGMHGDQPISESPPRDLLHHLVCVDCLRSGTQHRHGSPTDLQPVTEASSPARSTPSSQPTSPHPVSPWLNWSCHPLSARLDELNAASLCRRPVARSGSSDWVRRASLAFLNQYVQYLIQEVGFCPVSLTKDEATDGPSTVTRGLKQTGSYALLHRAIHLAGVHIFELFIRQSRLYVRLGTIELSRFTRHASRNLITGPLSAAVITDAASSAAQTAASVRRAVAASIQREALKLETQGERPRYTKLSANLPWDESSRLYDYTHVHSFSYDFYLRTMQEYLLAQRSTRKISANAIRSRRTSTVIQGGNPRTPHSTELINFPDYPVTDFLSDIYLLAEQPPVYARSCLRKLHFTCPISECLKPEQVFHHLIEEHNTYELQIIRMTQSSSYPFALAPSNESFAFGILESLQVEASPPSTSANRLSTSVSHSSTSHGKISVDVANHIDIKHLANPSPTTSGYLLTAVVVAEHKPVCYKRPEKSPLHLTLFTFATNVQNVFPKSRLAWAVDRLSLQAQCPVRWFATAPFLDITTTPAVRELSQIRLTSLSESFTGSYSRSPILPINLQLSCQHLLQRPSKETHSSIQLSSTMRTEDEDTRQEYDDPRWHVSYLGTWPSHQVPVQRAIAAMQTSVQERLCALIEKSGVDCHKNLLWYRLFDVGRPEWTSVAYNEQLAGNMLPQTTVADGTWTNITLEEVEELAHSAPFVLDVLQLDNRLTRIFELGAEHLSSTISQIRHAFASSQSDYTCMFIRNASKSKMTYTALVSPKFTDGFVLLSWASTDGSDARAPGFCDFGLRVYFRTLGDPLNPNSVQPLIGSDTMVQQAFFERSPLAAYITNFVERLSFFLWKGLHVTFS